MQRYRYVLVIVSLMFPAGSTLAETCLAPSRPFVPSDPQAAQEFSDLIQRAFEEAREVSEEYGKFLGSVQR